MDNSTAGNPESKQETPQIPDEEMLEVVRNANVQAGGIIASLTNSEFPTGSLLATMMNAEDDDQRGDAIGSMFKDMMRAMKEPQPEGVNPVANILSSMFGPELAAQAMREIEIREFFTESLKTNVMREAIVLTKERFNLPDNCTMSIPLEIVFCPQTVSKTEEPSND